MQARELLLLCVGLCLAAGVPAQEPQPETAPDPQPSLEMLEFLGLGEKIDGHWWDPSQMQEVSVLQPNNQGDKNE